MLYHFFCDSCSQETSIERSIGDCYLPMKCSSCGSPMRRAYYPPQIMTKRESNPYFHPALGKIVKSDEHARQLAKEKGWVEVGNEDMNKHAPKPKRIDYDEPDYFIDNGSISSHDRTSN